MTTEPQTGEPKPGETPIGESPTPRHDLPTAAIGRLSLYLRELQRLSDRGTESINSHDLARLIDVSPASVRKDLAAIGAIGRRGVGYPVPALIDRIGMMLGNQTHWNVVLIGAGSLGTALLRYRGFQRQGFRIVGAFDLDPRLIGKTIDGVTIHSFTSFSRSAAKLRPQMAVLAVPADSAAAVAAELVAAGVTGILNFAPTSLKLPRTVGVVNVDLASDMQRLAFAISRLPGTAQAQLPPPADANPDPHQEPTAPPPPAKSGQSRKLKKGAAAPRSPLQKTDESC